MCILYYISVNSQNLGGGEGGKFNGGNNNTKADIYWVDWSFWDWGVLKDCSHVNQ